MKYVIKISEQLGKNSYDSVQVFYSTNVFDFRMDINILIDTLKSMGVYQDYCEERNHIEDTLTAYIVINKDLPYTKE